MADVKTIRSKDKWNLNAIFNKVIHEKNNENFAKALKYTKEGLALASRTNNKEWIQKFDLLYTQTISEFNNHKNNGLSLKDDNDLTQVTGIGETAQRNLNNAGITTITQLAAFTPQKLSKVKGIGLSTAQKIVDEVKIFVGDNKKHISSKSSITTLDEWQGPNSNNKVNNQFTDFTLDKILSNSNAIDKQFSSNNRDNLKEKMHNILNLNENISEFDNIQQNQETNKTNFIQEPNSIKTIEKSEDENSIKNWNGQNLKIINDFLDGEPSEIHSVSQYYNYNPANDLKDELQLEILEKNHMNNIRDNLDRILKSLEVFVLPKSFSFNSKINNYIDSIGIKIFNVKKDLDIIIITLIKVCNLKGTLIVSDDNIDYQPSSPNHELNDRTKSLLIHPIKENLLQTCKIIHQDITQEGKLFEFFKKFLKVHISLEKNKNKISFRSGLLQYQIFIEPILLCQNDPISIEKSVVYPYQFKSNIHYISWKNISKLNTFLEKKYELIKTYAPQNDLVDEYFKEKLKFINNLRLYSLPFVVFGFIFLFLLILQLELLINSFTGLAFAVICLYPIVLLYSYLKFYKVKSSMSRELSASYHHEKVAMDETDILMISKELNPEDMDQFIYECFGKKADFKIIPKLEEQKMSQGVTNYKRNKLFNDSDNDPLENSVHVVKYPSTKKDKITSKYGSFLED